MSDVTLGTVTAKTTTDNSQFDAAMQKSSAVMSATARENAKAAKLQAEAIALASKMSGDAVSQQSLRIIASFKAQSAAEADMRKARQLSKVVDEQSGTQLLAAAYQRLTAAKLETAAASRVEAAATEATVLTQRQAVSAVVRASEGQQGIRAVEGFITMIPGVGAAMQAIFPLVGGAMFLSMLAKMGTELYDLEQKGKHAGEQMGRSFAEMNDKLAMGNDELELQTSKVQDAIAKMEKTPSNGLRTALLEAAVAADHLQQELAGVLAEQDQVLKKNAIGRFEGMLSGTAPTASAEKEVEDLGKKTTDAAHAENVAFRAAMAEAGADEAKREAAKAAHYARMDQIIRAGAVEMRKRATDEANAQKTLLGRARSVLNPLTNPLGYGEIDNSARRVAFEGAAVNYDDLQRRNQDVAAADTTDQSRAAAEKKKEDAEIAKQAAAAAREAQNKAAESRLRAMETALRQQEMQQSLSLKSVYDYWERMKSVFSSGSTQYDQIVAKQADLSVEAQRRAHEGLLRAAELAKKEDTGTAPSFMAGPDKSNELAAKVNADRAASVEEIALAQARIAAQMDEARVHEQAGRQMSSQDAERALAVIHTREYVQEMAALTAQQKRLQDETRPFAGQGAMLTPEQVAQMKQLLDLQKQIAALNGGRQLQQQTDAFGIQNADVGAAGGAVEALQEFAQAATDAGNVMKSFFGSSLNEVNGGLVKMLTDPQWQHRNEWGGIGHEIFTNATSGLLKGAEGSLLKGFGMSKVDGSSAAAALWVRMASVPHAVAGAAQTASSTANNWAASILRSLHLGGGSGAASGLDSAAGSPDVASVASPMAAMRAVMAMQAPAVGTSAGMSSAMPSLMALFGVGAGTAGAPAMDPGIGTAPNAQLAALRTSMNMPAPAIDLDMAKGMGMAMPAAMPSLMSLIPSFDVGTNYVPDDMLAMIHKGEKITPAAYNDGGSSGDTHYHIDARGATDPAQVRFQVEQGIRRAAPQLIAASVSAGDKRRARLPAGKA